MGSESVRRAKGKNERRRGNGEIGMEEERLGEGGGDKYRMKVTRNERILKE